MNPENPVPGMVARLARQFRYDMGFYTEQVASNRHRPVAASLYAMQAEQSRLVALTLEGLHAMLTATDPATVAPLPTTAGQSETERFVCHG